MLQGRAKTCKSDTAHTRHSAPIWLSAVAARKAAIRCWSAILERSNSQSAGQGRSRCRGRGACGEGGAMIWAPVFWEWACLS